MQQLRQAQAQTSGPANSVRCAPLSTRQWRVGDRLSEADTEQLVSAFTAGTSKRKLAHRYGISESSVKRLTRLHGASEPSNGLSEVPIQSYVGKGSQAHHSLPVNHAMVMRYPRPGMVSMMSGSPSFRRSRPIVTCTVLVNGSAFHPRLVREGLPR